MRKLFFFILIPICVCSQNLEVSYNFQIVSDNEVLKSEFFGIEFGKGVEGAKYLNFVLLTNDSIAVFKTIEILDNENNEIKAALDYSAFRKNIFSLEKFNYINNEELFCAEDTYLIKKTILNNWTLLNETKKIDGYLCYKATTVLVKEDKYLNETFRFPVIAWYCPKIPSKFGPAGYGMLPGLILELQENRKIFTVNKIKFNDITNIIKFPRKGILILENDYNDLIFNYIKEVTGK